MKRTNILSYFFILELLMCSGCRKVSPQEISVNELKQEIKNNQSLVIIDVRTPAELYGPLGKIDGVINIPIDELEKESTN